MTFLRKLRKGRGSPPSSFASSEINVATLAKALDESATNTETTSVGDTGNVPNSENVLNGIDYTSSQHAAEEIDPKAKPVEETNSETHMNGRSRASIKQHVKNKLPSGMPEMPDFVRLAPKFAERHVASIDRGLGIRRRKEGSVASRSSRGSSLRESVTKMKTKLKRIFGRSTDDESSSDDGSTHLDDVPEQDGIDSTIPSGVLDYKQAGSDAQLSDEEHPATVTVFASAVAVPYDYHATELRREAPHTRLHLRNLSTKGQYVSVGDEVSQHVRCHDNNVSFVVPPGWIAIRTHFGFYLGCGSAFGCIYAVPAKSAPDALLDTKKLSVLSNIHVSSSPVFESQHRIAVRYTAHDIEGRGYV